MATGITMTEAVTAAPRAPARKEAARESSLLYLLQVASQAFPVGSFSHSYGFESLIVDGYIKNADDLGKWAGLWMRCGLATADGAAVRLARAAAIAGDWAAIEKLDAVLTALKLGKETRAASLNTGDAFVRAVLDAFGGERLSTYGQALREGRVAGHYATAFGVGMADAGIGERESVAAFLQSSLSSLVGVAARIIPLGQFETQRILADARPQLSECARIALDTPADELGTTFAILDIASMQHERLYSRLCIS